MAVAGSIGVDGYQADISLTQLLAPGVDALGAGAEGDVVFFRRDEGGVEAAVLEVLDYCSSNLAGVGFLFPHTMPPENIMKHSFRVDEVGAEDEVDAAD